MLNEKYKHANIQFKMFSEAVGIRPLCVQTAGGGSPSTRLGAAIILSFANQLTAPVFIYIVENVIDKY